MREADWVRAAAAVLPYVVKIETPDSYGSGFLICHSADGRKPQLVVATASHVVEHAMDWEECIRVSNGHGVILLPSADYEVVHNPDSDLAMLHFDDRSCLHMPNDTLPWCGKDEVIPTGHSVGWSGFPNVADVYCCFFAGHISASPVGTGRYLVDGVVINGVSGGPAFVMRGRQPQIVGVVSAYILNRARGETSPGLGVVSSISSLLHYITHENRSVAARRRTARARRIATADKKRRQL
jgi:hypothetical protein